MVGFNPDCEIEDEWPQSSLSGITRISVMSELVFREVQTGFDTVPRVGHENPQACRIFKTI